MMTIEDMVMNLTRAWVLRLFKKLLKGISLENEIVQIRGRYRDNKFRSAIKETSKRLQAHGSIFDIG